MLWVALVLAVLCLAYRVVDPLPPRHVAIAAGIPGTGFDDIARQYARILVRDGVTLDIRNYASSVEHFDVLRDARLGVQAAITNFGFTQPRDRETLASLGGVSDTPLFIFSRTAAPLTHFAQFRGKRLSLGMPGTSQRTLLLEVLPATEALDPSTRLIDLNYADSLDSLIAGTVDVAAFPAQLGDPLLKRAFGTPGIHLMHVAQAEAIAKTVPGVKHLVLWRGLANLPQDIPAADTDLLAFRTRVLVRKDLHPALQYLLLDAMREVHGAPGPFNTLGEFPAEQPNDLPLSPTAKAFYRSDPSFWQRYTAFWLTSLVDRIVFFVIPVVGMLIPVIGFAPRAYRWLHVRRIGQLHRALGHLERELDKEADAARVLELQARLASIESMVRVLKVARPFTTDLLLLRKRVRMAQEDVQRMGEGIE